MGNEGVMKMVYILIIFILGFLASEGIHYFQEGNVEVSGYAVKEPSDVLNSDKVFIYSDRVVLNVEGASLSGYDSTGSMRPLLYEGANGIMVKPEHEEDIHVGDIISFKQQGRTIVHRVVAIESDFEGVYFITQGDNNPTEDAWKVRFNAIEGKLIGVLY